MAFDLASLNPLGSSGGPTSKEFGSSSAATNLGGVTIGGAWSNPGAAPWLPWALAGGLVLLILVLMRK